MFPKKRANFREEKIREKKVARKNTNRNKQKCAKNSFIALSSAYISETRGCLLYRAYIVGNGSFFAFFDLCLIFAKIDFFDENKGKN